MGPAAPRKLAPLAMVQVRPTEKPSTGGGGGEVSICLVVWKEKEKCEGRDNVP